MDNTDRVYIYNLIEGLIGLSEFMDTEIKVLTERVTQI